MRHWVNHGGVFISKAAVIAAVQESAKKMSRQEEPIYTLKGYHLGETAKAVHFEVHEIHGRKLEIPKKEWFPFSQMKSSLKAAPDSGEFDEIVVKEWILKAKNLL